MLHVTVHAEHKGHQRTMNKLRRFLYLHERIVGEFHKILNSLTGRLSPWPFYSASAIRRGAPAELLCWGEAGVKPAPE